MCVVRDEFSLAPVTQSALLSSCLMGMPTISVPIGDPQSNRNPQLPPGEYFGHILLSEGSFFSQSVWLGRGLRRKGTLLFNGPSFLCCSPGPNPLDLRVFVLFWFWFFKTGFLCVALEAVLELTLETRLASNSHRSACLCLPSYWD